METNDHKRQTERQGESYKNTYLCAKQLEERQDQELDHQAGQRSLLEVSADDNIPGVVSEEIQQETQVVREEDKEEN